MDITLKTVCLFLTVLIQNTFPVNAQILNIGHRGARGHVAENTLESIKKAMELGVDGVEIDVFKCKSGEIVVIHDETVNRTTNGKGKVESFTLEELKSFVIEGKYKIATLQEVLDLLEAKYILNIELKGMITTGSVNKIVLDYIENKGWRKSQFIISSFQWEELRDFYKLNPEIPIGILTEKDPLKAINIAKELNAVSIHPYFKHLNKKTVDSVHNEGFKVYTWTVNKPKDIQKMLDAGVDAIITDFPERV